MKINIEKQSPLETYKHIRNSVITAQVNMTTAVNLAMVKAGEFVSCNVKSILFIMIGFLEVKTELV